MTRCVWQLSCEEKWDRYACLICKAFYKCSKSRAVRTTIYCCDKMSLVLSSKSHRQKSRAADRPKMMDSDHNLAFLPCQNGTDDKVNTHAMPHLAHSDTEETSYLIFCNLALNSQPIWWARHGWTHKLRHSGKDFLGDGCLNMLKNLMENADLRFGLFYIVKSKWCF